VVTESRVDGGPILKRHMPRARGTAYPIKRRYSHIHITLTDVDLMEERLEDGGGE
jgi:large subunit ribosomal protein L22